MFQICLLRILYAGAEKKKGGGGGGGGNPAKLYAIAIEKVCLANGMIRPPLHHMSIGNVKNINFFRLKFLR
jgi:hypothetical protein